jgi:hypothetical protein
MAVFGILGIFFHRVAIGPKLPQPEPVPPLAEQPAEVEAARKETP